MFRILVMCACGRRKNFNTDLSRAASGGEQTIVRIHSSKILLRLKLVAAHARITPLNCHPLRFMILIRQGYPSVSGLFPGLFF
jgi:hypothetical protein